MKSQPNIFGMATKHPTRQLALVASLLAYLRSHLTVAYYSYHLDGLYGRIKSPLSSLERYRA